MEPLFAFVLAGLLMAIVVIFAEHFNAFSTSMMIAPLVVVFGVIVLITAASPNETGMINPTVIAMAVIGGIIGTIAGMLAYRPEQRYKH